MGAAGDPIRILGVDPGSRHTGWGLVEKVGGRVLFLDAGAISTSPRLEFPQRLLALHAGLQERISIARPHEVAVEDIFHSVNTRSALQLAHVRGVLLLAVAGAGLPVSSYAPRLVKQAVVGHGNADKAQVAWMVTRLLAGARPAGLRDVTDALAVALCHAAHRDQAGAAAARRPAGGIHP